MTFPCLFPIVRYSISHLSPPIPRLSPLIATVVTSPKFSRFVGQPVRKHAPRSQMHRSHLRGLLFTRIHQQRVLIVDRNARNRGHQILKRLQRHDSARILRPRLRRPLRGRFIHTQNARCISTNHPIPAGLPNSHEVPVYTEHVTAEQIRIAIHMSDHACRHVEFEYQTIFYLSHSSMKLPLVII